MQPPLCNLGLLEPCLRFLSSAFVSTCMVNAFLRLPSFILAALPLLPLQVHGHTIKRHPIIALLPIFMTGIMIGLGVWGVLAASQQYSNDKQNQAQVSEQGAETGRGPG